MTQPLSMDASVRASAAVQARVIGALILRETRTRFGKSQVGYLWAITEPVAAVVTFTLMFMALGRPAMFGDNLFLFFATGVLPYQIYRKVCTYVMSAPEANQALLNYPIVKQIDTMIARAALEIATALVTSIMIFGALIVFAGCEPPARFLAVIASLGALALLGFGTGVINAVIIQRFDSWKNIEALISKPFFFISGIFFLPETLPEPVRDALSWNPILHGIEWMRYGFYFNYRAYDLDVLYLLNWALITTLIGLAAERATRRPSQ
ncbi:MAG: ABC transporter permease [Hyphomicrobiales bacterium]|nr:ABC transporter permease [Hyphomicrobiales bacterium]